MCIRDRFGLVDLAHDALPGDHRAMVRLAKLLIGRDVKRTHEMLHVELIGPPRAALFCLASQISSSGMSASLASGEGSDAPEAGSTAGGRSVVGMLGHWEARDST